jgi:hypothetical protein
MSCAHVGDAVRERALPAGDHLEDLAQLARLQTGTQGAQRRVAALDVPDARDQTAGLEGLDQTAGAFDRVGDRLLDQGADAGLGELQADFLVQRGGAGHHGVVDAEPDQFLDGGQHRSALGPSVLVAHRVDDADQRHVLQAGQHARVVAAHRAETDQSGSQSCGHCISPSEFTATTIRSRSSGESEGCTGSETTSAAARSVSGRSQVRPAFWSGSQYGFSRWIGVG